MPSHIHHASQEDDSETEDFEIPHSFDRLFNILSRWGRSIPESEGPHSRTTLSGQDSPGFATTSHPQETAMDQTQKITETNNKTEGEWQTSFGGDYGKFNKVLHYEGYNTVELYEKKVPVDDQTTSPAKFPKSHILETMRRTFTSNTIKELYAVKVYRHAKIPLSPPARPLQNQSRTVSLCHPNIVPIMDILYNKHRNLCLIMPYYAGGTLHSFLSQERKPNKKLNIEELDCLTIQILRAVAFLHENDIAHGDLRPEHILLTAHGAVKVGGFGEDEDAVRELAELLHSASEDKPNLCIRRRVSESSVPYLPPERFSGHRGSHPQSYTHKDVSDLKPGDIWACGVICMLFRSGKFLWHSAQRVNKSFADYLHYRLEEDGYGPIQVFEHHYRNVIYAMLHPDLWPRITAEEVLRSEWALGVAVCEIGEMGC
ncbi:Tyrosine-protein kinase, catalytic domain [Penicillium camemberti]|uniref:non-specific serine/threonine protein kinase n=1 Tax=Penicillium camemberti (strain FM 013) TaxID=1429867 RepID=A0A0G4PAP7_PENC3|nr:Tyrosine-protein kinase, catalytic domain [Penicillium camemberti]